jgi:hypothetical protein
MGRRSFSALARVPFVAFFMLALSFMATRIVTMSPTCAAR